MPSPHRVALLGFSDFERRTLGAYIRLASNRTPRYEVEQLLGDAHLVVADAEHAPSVQLVLATDKQADTVFIGASPPPGAGGHLPRPLDAMRVLRALDAIVAARTPAPRSGDKGRTVIQVPPPARSGRQPADAPGPAPAMPPAGVRLPLLDLPLIVPSLPAAADATPPAPPAGEPAPEAVAAPAAAAAEEPARAEPAPAEPAATEPASAAPAPAAPAPSSGARRPRRVPPSLPAPPSRALIVDDSEIAQRYLQLRLAAYGLQCDCVATSVQALDRLLGQAYDLVFLDMELGPASEQDGLGLCQRIKRDFATRMPPPQVMMVTAHHGELDRVRGALAGCDGFLGKPLDDGELDRLLVRQGLRHARVAGKPARAE